MKVNCTARYTVWVDWTVEAASEEEALDRVIEAASVSLNNIHGVVEIDLDDCETSVEDECA